jgi:hypothetical protein
MSEWQPIESAPRDGTDILGCWCRSNVMGVVSYFGGIWLENDEKVSAPSHWMPLPDPPDHAATVSSRAGQ